MNCNVEITAVGTADGLEVSIHGGSVGMMTAAELIVARVLMAVADDEENLAGLKDSMFEIINEMVKDCWAEKTAKTEAEKEAAVNKLKALWQCSLNRRTDTGRFQWREERKQNPLPEIQAERRGSVSSEFTPFVAASMREMLLDMLEKHPEIFDRPTRYPEGRAEFLKQKEPNHG